jgi:hypothetical protein
MCRARCNDWPPVWQKERCKLVACARCFQVVVVERRRGLVKRHQHLLAVFGRMPIAVCGDMEQDDETPPTLPGLGIRLSAGQWLRPGSLERAVHSAMMANELHGGRGACRISNAGTSASLVLMPST